MDSVREREAASIPASSSIDLVSDSYGIARKKKAE
jgi:hypothetical protein